MDKHPKDTFIAHIRESDGTIQSVKEHCQSVAALAKIAGETYGIGSLCSCSGRHHDIGKNTIEFQDYILAATSGQKVQKGSVIHSTHGAYLINSLRDDNDPGSKLAAELIRNAIMSHHGIRDAVTVDGKISFDDAKKNIVKSREEVRQFVLEQFGEESIKKEFDDAAKDANTIIKKIKEFCASQSGLGSAHIYLALFQRLLTSILIDSDRTDTACFEDNIPSQKRPTSQDRIKLWQQYRSYCDQAIEELKKAKTPSSLDIYRAEISDICANFPDGGNGIFRFIVPCGAGKTLSALRFALQTAERFGKERIFYIAPYNSILEQNADEIGKFIGDDDAVLRHHSNVVFEDHNDRIKNHNGDNMSFNEKEQRYQLLTENWLQSPIIATSAVQFLNTLFLSKTSAVRRMQALGNSVIIFDEVQSLPIRVLKLFNAGVNFLSRFCHSSVVLCSATQPSLDKLNNYRLTTPRNLIEDFDKYSEAFRRIEIEDSTQGNGMTFSDAADFIFDKAQSVRSLLAIVNTKKSAKLIAKRLEELIQNDDAYKLFHLSTNMCPAHRSSEIQKLRTCLADKNNPKKIICVSTTLIEAGVDVSFEAVVRSLTGLDSIIQAAGRCNRNYESERGSVSLIYINEEKIEKLDNLVEAQNVVREILYSVKKNPNFNKNNYLSKQVMDFYYNKFYRNLGKLMEFPLKDDPEHTIIDLLTTNNFSSDKNPDSKFLCLKQAFKKAGDVFEVIDNNGQIDVIVEYNDDAKDHIRALRESRRISDQKKELRYLQRYTLQLYLNSNDTEGYGIYKDEKLGIYFLASSYYDQTFGIVHENVFLDF